MMDSLQDGAADVESLGVLSQFRLDLHPCLTARTDELCKLADAVLCAGGPVRSLAGLSLPSIATGVPLPGVITASGLLDGRATLVEASRRARKFADWLCALTDAGYELEGPFLEDWGVYGSRGLAARTRVANPKAAGK